MLLLLQGFGTIPSSISGSGNLEIIRAAKLRTIFAQPNETTEAQNNRTIEAQVNETIRAPKIRNIKR